MRFRKKIQEKRIDLYTRFSGGGGSFFEQNGTPLFAYSLRDLNGENPEVVTLLRTSDSAEDTFTASQVQDGTVVESFASGGVTQIKTLKCQVSSDNDITIGSGNRRPSLTDVSGNLVRLGGFPAMRFVGSDNINFPSLVTNQVNTVYRVQSPATNLFDYILIWDSSTASNYGYQPVSGSGNTDITSNYGSPTLYVDGVIKSPTNRGDLYTEFGGDTEALKAISVDGEDVTLWGGNVGFGRSSGDTANFDGYLSEYICYSNATNPYSSNVVANQMSAFGIS